MVLLKSAYKQTSSPPFLPNTRLFLDSSPSMAGALANLPPINSKHMCLANSNKNPIHDGYIICYTTKSSKTPAFQSYTKSWMFPLLIDDDVCVCVCANCDVQRNVTPNRSGIQWFTRKQSCPKAFTFHQHCGSRYMCLCVGKVIPTILVLMDKFNTMGLGQCV